MPGLGRVRQEVDLRDLNHLARTHLETSAAQEPRRSTRYWLTRHEVMDQGETPHCTGFAGKHWLMTAPVMDPPTHPPDGHAIYAINKQHDGFANEEGSTTRALMQTLRELGTLDEYVWMMDDEDARDFILTTSPVLAGTAWFTGMFDPDDDGFVWPRGRLAGGHEYELYGFSEPRDAFRCLNSWGLGWGQAGRFWLRRDVFGELLAGIGEAAGGIQTKRVSQ
jgi:hypothetical protein